MGFSHMAEFIDNIIIPAYDHRLVNIVTHTYDSYIILAWKNYFDRFMHAGLKYHSHWRAFKFTPTGDNDVQLFFKADATSEAWVGYNGSFTEGMFIFYRSRYRDLLLQ